MDGDREQLSGRIAAALAAADPIRITAGNPDPVDEYRQEADLIVSGILRLEADGPPADQHAVAKVVRSVFESQFDQRIRGREAKVIAEAVLVERMTSLVHATIAEEAARVLADGRAALRRYDDFEGNPVIELTPVRKAAASLIVYVEYDRLAHCSIGARAYGTRSSRIVRPRSARRSAVWSEP